MQNKMFLPGTSSGSDAFEYKENREQVLPFVNVIDNFPTLWTKTKKVTLFFNSFVQAKAPPHRLGNS